jgi:hypothetical protein
MFGTALCKYLVEINETDNFAIIFRYLCQAAWLNKAFGDFTCVN